MCDQSVYSNVTVKIAACTYYRYVARSHKYSNRTFKQYYRKCCLYGSIMGSMKSIIDKNFEKFLKAFGQIFEHN